MHAHRLRHTLATQAINRGMSLEAIAALLGHRSMRMTLIYARIADRTVANEYYAVTEQVEALYDATPVLPASAEGRQMRQLRVETYQRLLGNGYCTRPPELDCVFESDLRDLHPLPDRPRVPTRPAPPTRPRPRTRPTATRRAVQQAPRRHRQGLTGHQRLPCTTRNNPTDHRHIGQYVTVTAVGRDETTGSEVPLRDDRHAAFGLDAITGRGHLGRADASWATRPRLAVRSCHGKGAARSGVAASSKRPARASERDRAQARSGRIARRNAKPGEQISQIRSTLRSGCASATPHSGLRSEADWGRNGRAG